MRRVGGVTAVRPGRAVRAVRAVLASLSVVAAACDEAPTRDVAVGRVTRMYSDPDRTDWSGRGDRPLAATVWYRAAAGTVEAPWGAAGFAFGAGAPDAPFADTLRRPLILLSHGTGGSAAQLSWLAERLVAAGFVVAAVSHHGNTAAEERTWPHGFVLPWERARDLTVLLDRLAADSVLSVHTDTSRVGAAGFSLGGYTVLALAGAKLPFDRWRQECRNMPARPSCALPPEADFTLEDVDALALEDEPFRTSLSRRDTPMRDARVRAVFAMAPALASALDTATLASVAVPVSVVVGASDTQVPAAQTAELLARIPSSTVSVLDGVPHYAFLAPCTWSGRLRMRALCADGGASRRAVHDRVAATAVRFFRTQLADAGSVAPDDGQREP